MTTLLTHRDMVTIYDPITELWEVLDRLDTLIEYTGDLPPSTMHRLILARNIINDERGPVARTYEPGYDVCHTCGTIIEPRARMGATTCESCADERRSQYDPSSPKEAPR